MKKGKGVAFEVDIEKININEQENKTILHNLFEKHNPSEKRGPFKKRIMFKIFILTLMSILFCSGFVCAGTVAFKTKWTLPKDGVTVKLPIPYNEDNDYKVTWGDGSSNSYVSTRFPTHKYTEAGTYTISITGTVKRFGNTSSVVPTSTNVYSDYNSARLYLTAITAWGDIECTRYSFSGFSKLTGALPSPTGSSSGSRSFENLTSMQNMFRGTKITSVPKDFFKQCTKVTNMSYAFMDARPELFCWAEDMFSKCTEVTTFAYMFRNSAVESYDITGMDNLFANNTKVTSFAYMFYDFPLEGQLPSTLFKNNTQAEYFTAMFARSDLNSDMICMESTIPESLFATNTKAKGMAYVFTRHLGINGQIPENLFANCPEITTVRSFFEETNVSGQIPENLFANNKKITSFAYTFRYCRNLEGAVTEKLFAGNTGIPSTLPSYWGKDTDDIDAYRLTFSNCSGLTSLEINTPYIGKSMFYGCNNLTNITIGSKVQAIGTDAFEATSPYGPDNLLATTLKVLDSSGNEITDGSSFRKTYAWSSDDRLVDFEVNVNTIGNVTVNVTNFEKDTQMLSHNCEDYEVTEYDKTYHWTRCRICGNGEDNKVKHSFTNCYWTQGTSTCSSSNKYIMYCDCGYNKYDTNRALPKSHTLIDNISSSSYRHYKECTTCGGDFDLVRCTKSNGKEISCDNLGTCAVCGYNYTEVNHYAKIQSGKLEVEEIRCIYCNKLMANKATTTISYNGTTSVNFETVYNVPNGFTFDKYRVYTRGQMTEKSSEYSTAYRKITVKAVMNFNNSSLGSALMPGIATYWVNSNNENCYVSFYASVNPDTTAPTVKVTQNSLSEYNGWVTQPQYTISGTENYCKSVNIKVLDKDDKTILNAQTDVTSKAYSYTFTPDISSNVTGELYQIIVSDTVGNSTSQGLKTTLIDNVAPEITYALTSGTNDKAWSKTKDYKVIATDTGTNVAELMLQDGDGFTDEFGVTTIDNSTSPSSYARSYTFTGNVVGTKEIAVMARDEANNQVIDYIEVSNLDNTAPKFTRQIKINDFKYSFTVKDEESGIKYFAVSKECSIYGGKIYDPPTEYGTVETTTGNRLDYWYPVKNSAVPDENGNVPESDAKEITVSFEFEEDGLYTVIVQDLAGNIGHCYLSLVSNRSLATRWQIPVDVDGTPGEGTTITLPVIGVPGERYIVDWGDNHSSSYFGTISFPTHTYKNTEPKSYKIRVGGIVDSFGYYEPEIPTESSKYYDFTQYVTGIENWGIIGAQRIGFSNCVNLVAEIPEAMKESFINVTSMEKLFYGCKSLTGDIPENLFINATKVTSYKDAFNGCMSLSGAIPEALFANSKEVTSFENTFLKCNNLSGAIPTGLFANNTKVTTFANTFKDCIGLTGTIPENLFNKNKEVTDFSSTFSGCTKLSGMVPGRLFMHNDKVTNYSNTFNNCIQITAAELQINALAVANMDGMFKDCVALESVVFGEDVTKLVGTDVFLDCSALRALIFLNQPASTANLGNISDLATLGLTGGAIIYVPYAKDEEIYEKAWTNISTDKIEMLVKPITDPDYVGKGTQYVDDGYTIAGFGMDETEKYTQYGLYVVPSGDNIDTSVVGSQWIEYRLYKK